MDKKEENHKMDKKEELYLEYARCINMCKGTEVKSWECVRFNKISGDFAVFNNHPLFTNCYTRWYEFAVAILENKPVFVGDILYLKCGSSNIKCEVTEGGYTQPGTPGIAYNYNWWMKREQSDIWTWGSSCESTFTLNGVKLPCPIHSGDNVNNSVMIGLRNHISYFNFECSDDADLVAAEIIKILENSYQKTKEAS